MLSVATPAVFAPVERSVPIQTQPPPPLPSVMHDATPSALRDSPSPALFSGTDACVPAYAGAPGDYPILQDSGKTRKQYASCSWPQNACAQHRAGLC